MNKIRDFGGSKYDFSFLLVNITYFFCRRNKYKILLFVKAIGQSSLCSYGINFEMAQKHREWFDSTKAFDFEIAKRPVWFLTDGHGRVS